jgi:hypothetical protein
MSTSSTEQIKLHLECLGYAMEDRPEGRFTARHPQKFTLMVKPFVGGVLLTAAFGASDQAKRDLSGYKAFANACNKSALVARFYVDDDLDLMIEAFYPNVYDRSAFGQFYENLDHDHSKLLGNADALKYLK